jgi:hypothetical protein
VTLQDDLTATARLLVQLGQDLLDGEVAMQAAMPATREERLVKP